MNRNEREKLQNEIYEFMVAYQDEHANDPIPPTLGEIQTHFSLAGRNVALAHVKALVEEGLVEETDRGWRKYVAVKDGSRQKEEKPNATPETPKT